MGFNFEVESIVDEFSSNYREELTVALKAAEKAGQVMESYSDVDASIYDRKSAYSDIVTEADIDSQNKIVNTISQTFPEDEFLAEEEGLKADSDERYWVIDPIDGTTNFKTGFEYFCTSIALRIEDKPKVGVIYSPKTGLNKVFIAVEAEGSYVIDKNSGRLHKLSVSDRSLKDSSVVIDHSSITDKSRHINGDFINNLMQRGVSFRRPGSAALNLANIASGKLDGAIIHVSDWDYAAGELMIEEAGGEIHKNYLESNNLTEVIASNGEVQSELVDRNARYFNSE